MSRNTVLITGCSAGGIGAALAKEYHSRGLRVFATARRQETMQDLSSLGIEIFSLDVTSEESVKTARDRVAELASGKLDILVNNAGIANSWPATDLSPSEAREMFDVNIIGVITMVHHFAGLLVASGNGLICNIGSITGIMPYPFGAAYNASKAALHAYANTLRVELDPFNVKVITIVTGGVHTNIAQKARQLLPSSLYAPIADIYKSKRLGRSNKGAMSADAYAKQVVSQTLVPSPNAWFWIGTFSTLTWLMDTFLWRTAFDWILRREFGLKKLKNYLLNQKKVA